MFVPLSNVPRPYAWGSRGEISALLGRAETDALEAELWLGAHPAAPSAIHPPADVTSCTRLDQWISERPTEAVGSLTRLPFLMKVLAARAPLSLQVHPSEAWAARRFADENIAGIPLDSPMRNYRDPHHKPELILALEDGFEALCGVRPREERERIVAELGLEDVLAPQDMRAFLNGVLDPGAQADAVTTVNRVVAALQSAPRDSEYSQSYAWGRTLAEKYPNDPGIVVALMLNYVSLRAGEALFLAAGNLHAYLGGVGIEVMAASDNVLRGGLTEKHIDVPELLAVTSTEALPVPWVNPVIEGNVRTYRGTAREFELNVVTGPGHIPVSGPAIALNLGDPTNLRGANSMTALARGEAIFITPDEAQLDVSDTSKLMIVQPQKDWNEIK